MDSRPVVAAASSSEATSVDADQAIFTSVRSPTAVGYRLIAASAGITPDEKRELTQRSPSHDSLCDQSESAVAMSAYSLASGRHCVACSRHDGLEHTARGGYRVHTHIVVLDPSHYHRFDCNPVCATQALLGAIGYDPALSPTVRMAPLVLEPRPASFDGGGTSASFKRSCALAAALLAERCLLVVEPDNALRTLERVLPMLPLAARRTLAVSVGLKFAPSRRMQLSLVSSDHGLTPRTLSGTDVERFDDPAPPRPEDEAYRPWFELLRRWWREGRIREIDRLSTRIADDSTAQSLARIASICTDLDEVDAADQAVLETFAQRYAAYQASGDLERGLLRRLLDAAKRRAETLAQETEPSSET